MIELEKTDTWPEIVKVLDKYSMEAWRAGAASEQERIIKLLTNKQYFGGFLLNWAGSNPTAEDALLVVDTVVAIIKGADND